MANKEFSQDSNQKSMFDLLSNNTLYSLIQLTAHKRICALQPSKNKNKNNNNNKNQKSKGVSRRDPAHPVVLTSTAEKWEMTGTPRVGVLNSSSAKELVMISKYSASGGLEGLRKT